MAGLLELSDIYKQNGKNFLKDLFDSYVIVTEKIDGSTVSIEKDNESLKLLKKDGNSINNIDRVQSVYYEKAINFLESIPSDIVERFPDNWRMTFEYVVNTCPVRISYDRVPKNNLILTHISVLDDKKKVLRIVDNRQLLSDWARRLDVDIPVMIFEGVLNDIQKKKLTDMLELDVTSIKEIFGNDSFVYNAIGILNPEIKRTTLNDDIQKPIDSIVFKFIKEGKEHTVSAKLVDPYVKSLYNKDKADRVTSDIYSIVLVDIIQFIERNSSLINAKLTSEYPADRYLEIICDIFNKYIQGNENRYDGIDFETKEFANRPEFKLNVDKIPNTQTVEIIKRSKTNEDLFRILLLSLKKERKKVTPFLTETVLNVLNSIIAKIKKVTEIKLPDGFMTFGDYLNLNSQNESIYTDDSEDVSEDCIPQHLPHVNKIEIEQGMITEDPRKKDKKNPVNTIGAEHIVIINTSQEMKESFDIINKERGKKYVNIVVGRFQPFTNGHIRVAKMMNSLNGHPVMFICIRGKKTPKERLPFSKELQQKMLDALSDNVHMIEGGVMIEGSAALNAILDALRPKYEPVIWGIGSDRKGSYDSQIEKYKDIANLLPEFNIMEITRIDDTDVSGTIVRNAIISDDRVTFNKLVPNSLHFLYSGMKSEIEAIGK